MSGAAVNGGNEISPHGRIRRKRDEIAPVGPVQGDEQVIEKFRSYMLDDPDVIYQNKLASAHWRTGIRTYEIRAP